MNLSLKKVLLFALFPVFAANLAAQSGQVADRIVAVVNDRIVLKSDVDDQIRDYMRQAEMSNQPMQFSEELWYSVMESMIDNYVLLEKAVIDSVTISNEIVDRQMDDRIQQLVRQAGSEQALERAFGQSLIEIRADFREQFREQMIAQEVQRMKFGSIDITRPEVEEFFNSIPPDSIPMIPEQVGISQIVIIPEPLADARNAAFQKAQALRDSVTTHGKDFEEMARRHSEDVSAPRGGLLPMMPLGDLVANYSAAATALEPGEISEVVQTEFGYHVIRLNDRVGDNIETNHILVKIDDQQVDEEAARDELNAIRDSVLTHGERFSDMARKYSEDPATAPSGGRIVNPQTGARLFPIEELEPSLYRIVLLLDEEGQISEPRSYNPQSSAATRAFRIVRLDRYIPEHLANLDEDYEQIKERALYQKQMRILNRWIEDLRDEVFVEYKIPVPDVESLVDPLTEPAERNLE